MVVVTISAADWLSLGLEIVGFCPGCQNVCLKTKLERFRAHFGVSPETHHAIYIDLQTMEIATARIPAPDAFYFLMAFHWLKVYPTEAQSSAIFKCDDKTVCGEVCVLHHGFKWADGSISQNNLNKQCSQCVRKENDLRDVQCHHSTRQSQSAALMWHRYLESSS